MSGGGVVYTDDRVTVHHGDALDVLSTLPDQSVDAVVTDPPYSLGFMGRTWDDHREHDDDPAFGYYLAGLIDGEGCFRVQRHERGTHSCTFTVKLRADDRAILDRARRWLDAGQLTDVPNGDGHPQVRWAVQDKVGCQRLVAALDKYELRAKKRADFLAWREAVCEWTSMPRGNRWHGPADQSRMAALKTRIESGRLYVDPPWSGNGYQDWCRLWAAQCLRVLKPGGYLVAFGGTRTWHRLVSAVEDAGLEVRDSIAWLSMTGFPKSLDVSKAIDRAGGTSPADQAQVLRAARKRAGMTREQVAAAVGCTPASVRDWEEGRARAAGRAVEHITPSPQYRSRLADLLGYTADERTVTGVCKDRRGDDTVIGLGHSGVAYGTPTTDAARRWEGWGTALKPAHEPIAIARRPLDGTVAANVLAHATGALNIDGCRVGGRWPANVALDPRVAPDLSHVGQHFPVFRHEAKAGADERLRVDGVAHPTVKPLELMRWLVRLVTPPGGVVLDPFAGSGTTAEACVLEGFRCIAVEREPTYLPLIRARLARPMQPVLDLTEGTTP